MNSYTIWKLFLLYSFWFQIYKIYHKSNFYLLKFENNLLRKNKSFLGDRMNSLSKLTVRTCTPRYSSDFATGFSFIPKNHKIVQSSRWFWCSLWMVRWFNSLVCGLSSRSNTVQIPVSCGFYEKIELIRSFS